MVKIIGVRFRNAGKIYYFSPRKFHINKGDHVIVETARGIEYGTVVMGPKELPENEVIQPLKPVIRMADSEDDMKVEKNHEKEKEAIKICQEKIQKHGLEMKLIEAEYTFDNNKVLFYFTARPGPEEGPLHLSCLPCGGRRPRWRDGGPNAGPGPGGGVQNPGSKGGVRRVLRV